MGVVKFIIVVIQRRNMRKKIHGLANATIEMSPKQFIAMRKKSFGGKGRPSYANQHDFTGVYVLYNKTKDLYYVGQAKSVFSRVNNHFTGHGNGDVYADYKYGDQWTIQMLQLDGSGYSSLNELERHAINVFNAHKRGYNKTKGNKN